MNPAAITTNASSEKTCHLAICALSDNVPRQKNRLRIGDLKMPSVAEFGANPRCQTHESEFGRRREARRLVLLPLLHARTHLSCFRCYMRGIAPLLRATGNALEDFAMPIAIWQQRPNEL